jgi:hypothetical protein
MTRPLITPELIAELAAAVPKRAAFLWFYLWSRADFETSVTFPKVRTIGKEARIKAGHVCEDLRLLEAGRWLTVERKPGGRSSYTVSAPRKVYPETGTPPPQSVSRNGNSACPKTGTARIPKREHKNSTKEHNQETLKKTTPPTIEIPANLNHPDFLAAWNEWVTYRRERRLTTAPRTLARQLRDLAAWGPVAAAESIERSLKAGWQGLFEPRQNRNGKPRRRELAGVRSPEDNDEL